MQDQSSQCGDRPVLTALSREIELKAAYSLFKAVSEYNKAVKECMKLGLTFHISSEEEYPYSVKTKGFIKTWFPLRVLYIQKPSYTEY